MLVAYFFLISLISSFGDATIAVINGNNENLKSCVKGIIKLYYDKKMVTYVDINYDSNEIINIINSIPALIISKDTRKNLQTSNEEYVITVGTSRDFTRNFPNLMKEPRWNPYAKFLIIVKSLKTEEITQVFDILLRYHVNDVILVNGTDDTDLYTYNPFDKYNCGKKYEKIIEFGNCMTTPVKNLYPNKLVTGLRNCKVIVTTTHWPPYSIDPSKSSENYMIGVEQYVFGIISELENFQIEYTGSIDGEEFSMVEDNMAASGDMLRLQAQQTDVIFGGMLLLHLRADAFNYLCGHLPFTDNLRYFVQKADDISFWRNFLLEFDTIVWITLISCFICYFVLLVIILRAKDKAGLFLVMVDLLFLHGNKMISKSKGVFIFFVIFAYLINTYYQSALVSTVTNPMKNYQISTDQDLVDYKMQPCIFTGIQKFLLVVRGTSIQQTNEDGCMHLIDSLRTVSKTNKKYTVSLNSIYTYNKYLLFDEQGKELLYAFKRPINNVIYAIYLYKGFPMQERLNLHTIRMRENGLIDEKLKQIDHRRQLKFAKPASKRRDKKFRLIFSWYILLIGSIVATGLLFVERFFKNKHTRRNIDLSV